MINIYGLEIRLFGGFLLRAGGRPLPRLRSRQGARLVVLLALRAERDVPRTFLIDHLWPDTPIEQGLALLRRELTDLRNVLGPQKDRLLAPSRSVLRLDISPSDTLGTATVDVLAFENLAQHTDDTEKLDAALALYTGAFLEGFQDEWILAERERLSRIYRTTLQARIALAHERDAFESVLPALRQALADAPRDQELCRLLMQTLARTGQDAEIVAVYERLCRRLRKEAAEIDTETRILFTKLRERSRDVREVPPVAVLSNLSKWTSEPGSVAEAPTVTGVPVPSPAPLPLFLTRFFGRENEIRRLIEWLAERNSESRKRLLTLVGPGGAGKTRLAVEVGQHLRQTPSPFPAGIFFVSLAEVREGRQFAEALARALAIPLTGNQDPHRTIAATLAEWTAGDREALLILDNFEQLLPEDPNEAVSVLSTLLTVVPSLWCLVTSRQTLRLDGEQEFPLGPLPLPELVDAQTHGDDETPPASLALFVDRAKAVRPDFVLTPAHRDAVAALCRHLEGVPLALEMAAAWSRILSPAQILARFKSPLALESTHRGGNARHRSLRATLEWSYELLSPPLREFLAVLSVFRGSFSLEAAEAVLGPEAIESLSELAERSLISTESTESDRASEPAEELPRYRLPESVREFAFEMLSETGRANEIRGRHAAFFNEFITAIWRMVRKDLRLTPYRNRLFDRDYANILATLETYEETRNTAGMNHLCILLTPYWYDRSNTRESRHWVDRALHLSEGMPLTSDHALLLLKRGDYLTSEGRAEEALVLCDTTEIFFRSPEETEEKVYGLYRVNFLRCISFLTGGDREAALAASVHALEFARRSGKADILIEAIGTHALCYFYLERYDEADPLLTDLLTRSRQHRVPAWENWSLCLLTGNSFESGDFVRARKTAEEALPSLRNCGTRQDLGSVLYYLGRCHSMNGDHTVAEEMLKEALKLLVDQERKTVTAPVLDALADVFAVTGRPGPALYLYAATEEIQKRLPSPKKPRFGKDREDAVRAIGLVDEADATEWRERANGYFRGSGRFHSCIEEKEA